MAFWTLICHCDQDKFPSDYEGATAGKAWWLNRLWVRAQSEQVVCVIAYDALFQSICLSDHEGLTKHCAGAEVFCKSHRIRV